MITKQYDLNNRMILCSKEALLLFTETIRIILPEVTMSEIQEMNVGCSKWSSEQQKLKM